MDDQLRAAGKIAKGVVQVVSGAATATGHGLLGSYCKSHHMMSQAARIGSVSAKNGMESIKQGVEEWKRAQGS